MFRFFAKLIVSFMAVPLWILMGVGLKKFASVVAPIDPRWNMMQSDQNPLHAIIFISGVLSTGVLLLISLFIFWDADTQKEIRKKFGPIIPNEIDEEIKWESEQPERGDWA